MRFVKVIQRRIRGRDGGVDLKGGVKATVAANVGERGGTTHVSSTQRIVQRSGRRRRRTRGPSSELPGG